MKIATMVPLCIVIVLPLAGVASALSAQERGPSGGRSPGMALALSVVGTALPIAVSMRGNDPMSYALLAGGLVLGPVPGYVYAQEAERGMTNAGIRAAVLAATFGTALIIRDPNDDRKHRELLVPLILGGALAVTVLAVRDITRVDDLVRVRNRLPSATTEAADVGRGRGDPVAVSLGPAYFPEARAPGLVATWRH